MYPNVPYNFCPSEYFGFDKQKIPNLAQPFSKENSLAILVMVIDLFGIDGRGNITNSERYIMTTSFYGLVQSD